MKRRVMKTPKRTLLISFLLGSLFLFPAVFYGQEKDNLTNQVKTNSPPVAQTLVPEGLLAMELAKALKIGQPQNGAEAESMLSAIGIEPKNGWIADYPVTPDIIGEVQGTVGSAVDAKRLKLGKEQARKAMENVVSQLGLNVMAGSTPLPAQALPGQGAVNSTIYKYTDTDGVVHFTDRYENIPQEYRDQIKMPGEELRPQALLGTIEEAAGTPANSNPEVVNNYYYNYGPPVVTYYEPPWPYYYLYAWVPYPFRCSGFFFSGFFILHDFHRNVFFNSRGFLVTNHVFNPRTRAIFVVDPVKRTFRGNAALARASSPRVFSNASAQAGARAIVEISRQRTSSVRVSAQAGTRKESPSAMQNNSQPKADSNMLPAVMNRRTPATSSSDGSSGVTRNPTKIFRQPLPRERRVSRPEYIQRPDANVPQKSRDEQTKSFRTHAPREFVEPGKKENWNQGNLEREQMAENRQFHPPAAGGEVFHSNPPVRVFTPRAAPEGRANFGSASPGRSFSGGSRMEMGGSLGHIFSRGR